MENVLGQLSKPYIRPVKPMPVYRGTLTLGDPETYGSASLVIDVEMIARTMKAKPKGFKKYSALAETASNIENKTYEVSHSRTYSITVDENVNEKVDVPQDELDKAYTLGKTIIPSISKVSEKKGAPLDARPVVKASASAHAIQMHLMRPSHNWQSPADACPLGNKDKDQYDVYHANGTRSLSSNSK